MRKIIVHCDNSKSVGCDTYKPILVDDNATEEQINEIAWQMSCEWAGAYWDVLDASEYDITDEECEVSCISTEDIEYSWWDYNPEVHDGLRTGGGSFKEDYFNESDVPNTVKNQVVPFQLTVFKGN